MIGHIKEGVTWCCECGSTKLEEWRSEHAIHEGELTEVDGIRCDQCGMRLVGPVLPRSFSDLWRARMARRQRQARAEDDSEPDAEGDGQEGKRERPSRSGPVASG